MPLNNGVLREIEQFLDNEILLLESNLFCLRKIIRFIKAANFNEDELVLLLNGLKNNMLTKNPRVNWMVDCVMELLLSPNIRIGSELPNYEEAAVCYEEELKHADPLDILQ